VVRRPGRRSRQFYTSVFPSSSILDITRYGEGAPQAGTAMVVTFMLDGLELHALNGGSGFPFTEAVSLYVKAETQDEIDDLWTKLTDGGEPGRCGWLKDRYGFSWQIVPPVLVELLSDPDQVRAGRVMQAMLEMGKLDISALRAAADG
jgi:predicted 3-demethylubiquinone-9 3-methyltransferase (glyoxalase superfamily)